jgi:uncharacterized membrane protein (DUF4010 family)
MTFIALPVVPDDPIGPLGGVNPREVWLIAILLAGVSFLGYAAVKYLGAQHGVLLAAAAGGLVSSTAVAFANARRAAAREGSPKVLAAGVALATAVSFVRVLAIAGALQPNLLPWLGPPLAAAMVTATAFAVAWVYWRPAANGKRPIVMLRNPFGFWSVTVFALAMGVIILLARFVEQTFGAAGAIIGAATIGLFDVDAVTVSMARLVPQPMGLREGTYAILAAVGSNTISKLVIGVAVGRGWFVVEVATVCVASAAAAVAALGLAMLWAPLG